MLYPPHSYKSTGNGGFWWLKSVPGMRLTTAVDADKIPQARGGVVKMKSRCANCGMRKRAEKYPNSILTKIWRWHTGWCPGWKAYQKELAQQKKP